MKLILLIFSLVLIFSSQINMEEEQNSQKDIAVKGGFIGKIKQMINLAKWKDQLNKLRKNCQKVLGMDNESFKKITEACSVDPSDRKTMDLVSCLAVDAGFIDKKGYLQFNKIEKHLKKMGLNESSIEELDKTCGGIETSDDIKLLTMNYYECYAKYLPRNVLVL